MEIPIWQRYVKMTSHHFGIDFERFMSDLGLTVSFVEVKLQPGAEAALPDVEDSSLSKDTSFTKIEI